MSVRQAFLALLGEQPMHGYQLRAEFEARTGGTWPLNIGQAYTTLQRLARDGLVEALPAEHDDDPERFRLTAAGHDAVAAWWATPVERGAPARDELAIKLALAVTVPGVDVARLVQAQRTATMRAMHDYTRLKRTGRASGAGGAGSGAGSGARSGSPGGPAARPAAVGGAQGAPPTDGDLAWSLVLDSLVFQAEAELRWLDHVETRVLRARTTASVPGAARPADPADPSGAGPRPAPAAGDAPPPEPAQPTSRRSRKAAR